MMEGDRLVGVLSVYATELQPFGDDHKYLAERVATLLAGRLIVLSKVPAHRLESDEVVASKIVAER